MVEGEAARVPSARELVGLGSDEWARVVVHARDAMNHLDETDLTPAMRRLRAAPTSRLAGGLVRRELARVIAAGDALWRELHARLAEDERLPDGLSWLVAGEPAPRLEQPTERDAADANGSGDRAEAAAQELDGELDRLRSRARELRSERDDARRKADGAEARAETLEHRIEDLERDLERSQERIDELEDEIGDLQEDRRRAIERERRRAETSTAELREEVRELRRREQQRQDDRREAAAAADTDAPKLTDDERDESDRTTAVRGRAVPGRPSQLPEGVHRDTTAAAAALLTRGRRVLIDGYNVTRTHRDHLNLEQQREWLERLMVAAANRFGLHPEIVWDGSGSGGGWRRRGLSVHYTRDGVTADDEILFLVQASPADEPLVIVTDDAELRQRVGAENVDLVRTRNFLGAVE